ncbi:crossover junction endodeoxyribonuclease RuvC [Patescibacteria group bacterium]|nr:crossover junction endodeoxyribonuclease RuvC [Patescibacteria group bacterium]
MIILGIDPGTATTGYGVIRKIKKTGVKGGDEIKCLDYGIISTNPSLSDGERLKKIHLEISRLIKKHKPMILAVENIYFFKNLKTAFPVSQAKGVILLAAADKKILTYELTPLQAKMAITGYGRADKKQVQKMVKVLLNLKEIPRPDDASDALAIAIACSFMHRL